MSETGNIDAAIALNRLGLGAKPDEIFQVKNAQTWLRTQLVSGLRNDWSAPQEASSLYRLRKLSDRSRQRREAKRSESTNQSSNQNVFLRDVRRLVKQDVVRRSAFGATTDFPFFERLVRFWANHFSIAARNIQTRLLAGPYEREAIQPNILGRFSDLAEHAILHPGMLAYLDNARSVGPNSAGSRNGRRGLNENLAREVLELHTVTPGENYTQADVTELAKTLTGWTIGDYRNAPDETGRTIFLERAHEPGVRSVLGVTYPADGPGQIKAVLKDICRREGTAQNVAFKLARHFTSDIPPEDLVRDLKQTFLQTDGDLTLVYTTLIESGHVWRRQPKKLKSPEELLTSTARLLGTKLVFTGAPKNVYESLGQRPFNAPTPQGWPDTQQDWLDPNALMKRIEWANRVAGRADEVDARQLLENALGPLASEAARVEVSNAETRSQAISVALMSPGFQMR